MGFFLEEIEKNGVQPPGHPKRSLGTSNCKDLFKFQEIALFSYYFPLNFRAIILPRKFIVDRTMETHNNYILVES